MVLWLIFVFLDVCKFKGILLIKQGRIRYFLGDILSNDRFQVLSDSF